MTSLTVDQLHTYGPDQCKILGVESARSMCRRLTLGHYENFSVLSAVVPRDRRDDFASVYSFCRWADDLGDEIGDPQRSRELLAWWRRELQQCFKGEPRHPVFVALEPTIKRHDLPIELFDRLIGAFEQDQVRSRYDSWDQLLEYCKGSADPVGRLVLMMSGEPRTDEVFDCSDAICTALQLTNHWQDIHRDILERDRLYLPRDMIRIENFEDRLVRSAKQGFAVDREFLGQTRTLVRECVERTWRLFEKGERLLELVGPETRPLVWLLMEGGCQVLRQIELWNYETVLHRPKLGKVSRALLVLKAWRMAKLGARGSRGRDRGRSEGEKGT